MIGNLKGPTFSGPDDPALPKRVRKLPVGQRVAWWQRYQQRFLVAEQCRHCGRDLIAEEVEAHRASHLSPKARRLTRALADPQVQAEIKAYLNKDR